MKLNQKTIPSISFFCLTATIAASLTFAACAKTEWPKLPEAEPPKVEPTAVNPDDFNGCKRECLKGSVLCARMTATVFGEYEKDLKQLFSDAQKIPTGEESKISISLDSILDMNYMIISAAQKIRVKQSDVNDPDLEVLSNENGPQLEIKFKSDAVDDNYGGPISRIQFFQGLPIFTTRSNSCVGVL